MTSNQTVSKLTALKTTCRNVEMSFAPEEIEKIQVFIIEQEKRFMAIRKEKIKAKTRKMTFKEWIVYLGYHGTVSSLAKKLKCCPNSMYKQFNDKAERDLLAERIKGIK